MAKKNSAARLEIPWPTENCGLGPRDKCMQMVTGQQQTL